MNGVSANVFFERPTFDEIRMAIRAAFPMPGNPPIQMAPASFDRCLETGGIILRWETVPGWESYEYGHRDISGEEMMTLLFSPKSPKPDEWVIAVTDECFREQRGF